MNRKLFIDRLDESRIDIICRNCQETRQFDNDAAGTLDAHDCAFDSLERSFGNEDFLAFVELGCDVFEIEGFIGHDLADLHEICHGFV